MITVNLEDEMRAARPTSVFYCVVMSGKSIGITVGKVADHSPLFNEISDEGYDPEGPNGPTYWRVSTNCWYSTITRDGEFYLIITKLDPEAAGNAYTIGALGEIAVCKGWDELAPELARPRRSYEIVGSDRSATAVLELLLAGQITGHSDTDRHEIRRLN
jgi:hypothetical protein